MGITKVHEFCPANHVRVMVLLLLSNIYDKVMDTNILTSPCYTHMGSKRYISSVNSYIQSLRRGQQISKAPGPMALDILELFVRDETLSAYQVFSKLRPTHIKIAYKNVHKVIQRLLSLNLLIRTEKRRRDDHNAKYYRLSEHGIFRLFLSRHEGIKFNRLSTMKLKSPIIEMDREFTEYHSNCQLVKVFLSPLMDIRFLSKMNIVFLHRIYEYLHQCCISIENILQAEDLDLPCYTTIGSWSAITDYHNNSDRLQLLISLREKFELEHIDLNEYLDRTDVKVNDNKTVIEICNPQFRFSVYLNRKKKKAIASFLQGRRECEYEIRDIGSDTFIGDVKPFINWKIEFEFGERKQLDSLVYQIVSSIGLAPLDKRGDFKILARDTKFLNLVDTIQTQFEQGRLALLELKR